MKKRRVGVLVMSYGTPHSLAEIGSYYTHIRRGDPPSPEQFIQLTDRYRSVVGGLFPLREHTNRQVESLQRTLNRLTEGIGVQYICYQGLKHVQPYIEDGVRAMGKDGIKEAISIVLAPHYSIMSVGGYNQRAQEEAARQDITMKCVCSYHMHPGLIDAWVQRVNEQLAAFERGGTARKLVEVVFSAHSLPACTLDVNDPYPNELRATAMAIAKQCGLQDKQWCLTWQSASQNARRWLEPDLLNTLSKVAEQGGKQVLVVPIGFVSDHLEVLYDLDIEARQVANNLQLAFKRVRMLNDDPQYISVLADTVMKLDDREVKERGDSMNGVRDLVIVGGGITGLSAAYYAIKTAEKIGQMLRVVIVERSMRLGGKIDTLYRGDCIIEKGPDSFLARKQSMLDLVHDLGLESELVAMNSHINKTYIVKNGTMHRIPPGLIFGIPTKFAPFISTRLISIPGKLRVLMDFVKKPCLSMEDESLGSFLERRLGHEVVEYIAEPLLAGIYAGDMNKLSLQQTFPQFAEAERKYGSLIKGMMARRRRKAGQPLLDLPAVRDSTFLTFRSGLAFLVERLKDALHQKVDFCLGIGASHFNRLASGRYCVELDNGETIETSALIVATPSWHAADFLAGHVDASALQAMEHVSVANVVSVFERCSVTKKPLDGTGFLISRREKRAITACTWTSVKWPHTSKRDKLIIRCYIGRAGDEERVEWPDEVLQRAVRNELRDLMGITAKPEFVEITRLKRSMPQYPVGHVQAIKKLRAMVGNQLPGVLLSGQPYEGVGIPDCIASGRTAGEQAAAYIRNR